MSEKDLENNNIDEDNNIVVSEEESYVSVDDENVLNNVFEIFKEKFKDDFDFEE